MTRDERLLVLAAELRAAAPAPLRARALAERLAVTERTVQRDIAALARSGLPVRRIGADGYAVSAAARPGGIERVRLRVAGQADAGALRAVLGRLAEWTRWQVAAVRAVATGQDMVAEGEPGRRGEADGRLLRRCPLRT